MIIRIAHLYNWICRFDISLIFQYGGCLHMYTYKLCLYFILGGKQNCEKIYICPNGMYFSREMTVNLKLFPFKDQHILLNWVHPCLCSDVTALTSGSFWIAMFDTSKSWNWKWEQNPREVTWTKWAPNYPKRKRDDCVILTSEGFSDTVCTEPKTAICQKENASRFLSWYSPNYFFVKL